MITLDVTTVSQVTNGLKVKEGKHAMLTVIWSDYCKMRQSEFQKKDFIKEKGDFVMIKGSVYQEDIIILNVYSPNNRLSECMTIQTDRTAANN